MKNLLELSRPQVDTKGLILHYKLWSGLKSSGKIFDYSLNGNEGAPNGSNIVPVYPGFSFNGSNDYIDTGDPFQSTFRASFTFSIWAKLDDGQKSGGNFLSGTRQLAGANNDIFFLIGSTGTVSFYYEANGNSGTVARTAGVITDGLQSWKHFCFVADSTIGGVGGKKIYINGVIQTLSGGNGSTSGVTFAEYTSAVGLYAGARNLDGTAAGFSGGKFDDVMLFNIAKSALDIKNIYELTRWRYGV